jgi:hypothetical protein
MDKEVQWPGLAGDEIETQSQQVAAALALLR